MFILVNYFNFIPKVYITTAKVYMDPKILLVTNNNLIQKRFNQCLLEQKRNYILLEADTRSEMLHKVQTNEVTLIFIHTEDLDDSNVAVIAQMRTLDINIPAIVISHRKDIKFKSCCVGFGCDKFISLPFNQNQVTDIFNHYISPKH